MVNTMATTEYNGWPNYVTWDAFLWADGEYLGRLFTHMQRTGKTTEQFKEHFWFLLDAELHTGAKNKIAGLISDWLLNAHDWVDWNFIVTSLTTDTPLNPAAEDVTVLMLELVKAMDWNWRETLAPYTSRLPADDALKDWVKDFVITWYESVDARKYTSSPISKYCRAALWLYYQSVDWQHLYDAFKED